MEDRTGATLAAPRATRRMRSEEIDEEWLEETHGRGRLRELLLEREHATERFRALKRHLLARR